MFQIVNSESRIPQCGLRELEIYYLEVFHPASCIPKFRDAGCGMKNLQIIKFKLPEPALWDAGFEMRNIIIYNLYKNVITLKTLL